MDSKTEDAAGVAVADDLLLGCKEIAAEIGISPHAAWRLIHRGAIPVRRLGPRLWCAHVASCAGSRMGEARWVAARRSTGRPLGRAWAATPTLPCAAPALAVR
jgi:hypothetical protein